MQGDSQEEDTLVESKVEEFEVEVDTSPEKSERDPKLWLWLLESLFTQTLWGLQIVNSRYLQVNAKLPAQFLAWSGLTVLFLWKFPQALYQEGYSWLNNRWIWISAFVQFCRTFTNFQSHGYTSAVYIQLVSLSAPFFGAFLGKITSSQPLPRLTVPSLLASLVGGTLLFAGGVLTGENTETTVTWNSSSDSLVDTSFNAWDVVGMGLQLLSSFFLASTWFIAKKLSQAKIPLSVNTASTSLINPIALPLIGLAAGEDWKVWNLTWNWKFYLAFASLVFTASAGISLNIHAISKLSNPTIFAAITPLRLIVALAAGWVMLDEQISGVTEWLGLFIVFAAVTSYLTLQALPWLTWSWFKHYIGWVSFV